MSDGARARAWTGPCVHEGPPCVGNYRRCEAQNAWSLISPVAKSIEEATKSIKNKKPA